jgi:cytochrome b6-f complex iron-sulfur subunit
MTKKANTKKTETGTSRRDFLTTLWVGLGVVAVVEFVGVTIAFLQPRKKRVAEEAFGGTIVAGPVDDFEPDSVTAIRRGHFYLTRLKDGGFLAMSRKCTHLGCTVPWVEETRSFECPCHASNFDIRGDVTNPPAPRALDLHPIRIENNIVIVDTGKRIRRSEFREEQATYPEKGPQAEQTG